MSAEFYLHASCPDGPGLIAAITGAVSEAGGNILDLRQHTAVDIDTFFLSALFEADDADGRFGTRFADLFSGLAASRSIEWSLEPRARRHRVALLVSKTSHCLYELLIKQRDGELDCDFPVVVSNHPDLGGVAAQFGVPFETVDTSKGKEAYEADLEEILARRGADLVVLARYMQILSPEFTARWAGKVINIHHGFLPAFKGARPYHQAWKKGVKLIGATAHFVTEDLDQGPIISQDVIRVSDGSSIAELARLGKDVERTVLLDALSLYLSRSVFVRGERTFVLR